MICHDIIIILVQRQFTVAHMCTSESDHTYLCDVLVFLLFAAELAQMEGTNELMRRKLVLYIYLCLYYYYGEKKMQPFTKKNHEQSQKIVSLL